MSIITAYEAVRFSVVGREYPEATPGKLKDDIESGFFSECLGEDLYDLMVADKKSYNTATVWSAGATYAAAAFVIYKDTVFESKVAGNINHNPGSDVVETYWKPASKFTDTHYEELYTKYLRGIISNKIIKQTLAFDTMQIAGKGLTVQYQPDQTGVATADTKTIEYSLRNIQSVIDKKIELMKAWLIKDYKKWKDDTSTGYDWSVIPFVKSECEDCKTPQSSRRQMGFRSLNHDYYSS